MIRLASLIAALAISLATFGCANSESQRFAATVEAYDTLLVGVTYVAEQGGFTPAEARENLAAITVADAAVELWRQSLDANEEFSIAGLLEQMAILARNEAIGKERLSASQHDSGDRTSGGSGEGDRAGDAGEAGPDGG